MAGSYRGSSILGVAVLCLVVGCGGGPAGGPASAPPEPPEALRLSLELELIPNLEVEEYGDDLFSLRVTLGVDRSCDVAVPGPPALRLRIFDGESGEELPISPDPTRRRPDELFPISLEAGEKAVLGPMPMNYFDLDPRLFRGRRRYRVQMRYDPGEGQSVVEAETEVVAIPGDEPLFPLGQGRPYLPDGPPPREASALRLIDAQGAERRYMDWSPDIGLVPTR